MFCEQCGKVFKGTSSLRAHIASVHDKESKSVCPLCGNGFFLSEKNHRFRKHVENCKGTIRKRHVRTEYNCEVCGKTFNKSYNLKVHMTKHTGNIEKYSDFALIGRAPTLLRSH